MRLAIGRAKTSCGKVDWINAHATSTPVGDVVENRAIKTLLKPPPEWHMDLSQDEIVKDSVPEEQWKDVCVSSTKGATGHLLGAAGALEAIFSVRSIAKVCMEACICCSF